jgi:ABC-2 type transport system permease protein
MRSAAWLTALREDFELYLRLVSADIRSQMQYKASFAMAMIGMGAIAYLDFIVIVILFQRFPSIAGWSLGEVALIYGLAMAAFGLAELITGGFDHLPSLLLRGDFDRILVRPASTFAQLFSQETSLRRFGRIGQGLVAMALGFTLVSIDWTPAKVAYLLLSLASGAGVFVGVFIIGSVLCFWTIQSNELINIFTHGGSMMVSYPISVYEDWMRKFFMFVVPLAFVSYFPALHVLGRPDPLGLPVWLQMASPGVAVVFLAVAGVAWRFGVAHYQSTGS